MSDAELRDMLIQQLAMLYSIQAESEHVNKELNRYIRITEQRLLLLGFNNIDKLRLNT